MDFLFSVLFVFELKTPMRQTEKRTASWTSKTRYVA